MSGLLGVAPEAVLVLQLTEAVRSIQSNGNSLIGRPPIHDALSMRFKQFAITADPNRNACGFGVDRSLLPLCSD